MAKNENFSDSMNDVVETIGPVLERFIEDVIKAELPDCKCVYDPNMDYVTAITRFREQSTMMGVPSQALPLFMFRRSVLRWPEDGISPNRRLSQSKASKYMLSDGKALTFTPLFGEFDIEFVYINETMEDVEKFEITYLSDEGISGSKKVVLDLPELGEFNYFAEYNELTSLEVNYNDNFYKALAGVIKIRGMFFTFRSESSIIREVGMRFRAWIDEHENKTLLLEEHKLNK